MTIWLLVLGILGNAAFAYACVPTAYQTAKAGKSVGTPVGLAWNILTACLLFYSYVLLAHGFDWLIALCCIVEIASYAIVIYYHYFPRGTQ